MAEEQLLKDIKEVVQEVVDPQFKKLHTELQAARGEIQTVQSNMDTRFDKIEKLLTPPRKP